MVDQSSNSDSKPKVPKNPGEIYRDYLTVIYGLVATIGIERFADHSGDKPRLEWTSGLFLLASFLTGLHYWTVCVGYDDQSFPLYDSLSGGRRAIASLLLGVDAVAAAAFAAIIAVFFYSIPKSYDLLFKWFFILTVTSLAYDCYVALLLICGKRRLGDVQAKVHWRLVDFWFKVDGLSALVAATLFRVFARFGVGHELGFSIVFLAVASLIIVFEVLFRPDPPPTKPADVLVKSGSKA